MVKCADCGFLTLRDKTTGSLVEVNDDYRVSGNVPDYIAAYKEYHNYPICFVMAYDLMPEVEEAAKKQFFDKSDDWGKYVIEVITKERDCKTKCSTLGFAKYQQGFTPKEHLEKINRQRETKRRIIESIVFVILAGLFTLLGAFIANLE